MQVIILSNKESGIIDNNKYDYLPHKIMNYKEEHKLLNYPKEDFFTQNPSKEEFFYWKELFENTKINLNSDKVGEILSVNHELWDIYVPCVFMILEYKELNTNYLFISTHLPYDKNEEKIKLVFSEHIEEIFDFMETEPDLVCHIDSEFYEKEPILSYIEAKNLNNQITNINKSIKKAKL